MTKIAVLDDWQGIAESSTDWSPLMAVADVIFFKQAFNDEDAAVRNLRDFEIVLTMRERTPLPGSLIKQLPRLRMLGITGSRNGSLDLAACTAQGVMVCNTVGSGKTEAATAELALGLLLSAARAIPAADANMRAGRFQEGLPVGIGLAGKTIGIIGLDWSRGKDNWDHRSWPARLPHGSLLPGTEYECACLEREFDCRESSRSRSAPGIQRRIVIPLGCNQHPPCTVASITRSDWRS